MTAIKIPNGWMKETYGPETWFRVEVPGTNKGSNIVVFRGVGGWSVTVSNAHEEFDVTVSTARAIADRYREAADLADNLNAKAETS